MQAVTFISKVTIREPFQICPKKHYSGKDTVLYVNKRGRTQRILYRTGALFLLQVSTGTYQGVFLLLLNQQRRDCELIPIQHVAHHTIQLPVCGLCSYYTFEGHQQQLWIMGSVVTSSRMSAELYSSPIWRIAEHVPLMAFLLATYFVPLSPTKNSLRKGGSLPLWEDEIRKLVLEVIGLYCEWSSVGDIVRLNC